MKTTPLTAYLSLNETEQYEMILESGVLVGVHQDYPIKKYLYSLHAFFVEITCCEKSNRRLYKKIFKEGEILDNYLTESVDNIQSLLKKL
jgi:hypothetical protein